MVEGAWDSHTALEVPDVVAVTHARCRAPPSSARSAPAAATQRLMSDSVHRDATIFGYLKVTEELK